MLSVFLWILKIIGLIIGGVLAAALLIVCAALFVAVGWRMEARKDEGGVAADARLRWGPVTGRWRLAGGSWAGRIRVCGIPLPRGKKKADGGEKQEADGKTEAAQKEDKKEKKKGKPAKEPFGKRVSGWWRTASDFIGDPENRKLAGYTRTLIKKLLKPLKPRVLRVTGVIGFDDPANTGVAVGLIGGLALFWAMDIDVAGDFDRARLEGKIFARGKTRLCRLAFPLIRFILRKPVLALLLGRKKGAKS